MSPKSILFDISNHGLGHLAISAPVINELMNAFPAVRVLIRSGVPRNIVRSFVPNDFVYYPRRAETTLSAPNALEVDVDGTALAYEVLHSRWDIELVREAQFLSDIKSDLVVSNINYMPLAAAQKLGVKNVAICCMNWAEMFRFFGSTSPRFEQICRRLDAAYMECDLFLQPKPHMPMHGIQKNASIGPIARVGKSRRDELQKISASARDQALVLFSLGGLKGCDDWTLPRLEGVRWLVAAHPAEDRSDITSCHALDMPFADIVASVDAVVGKDSYGTVVEAACAGTRLVMLPRGHWPEEQCLSEWASKNCCFIKATTQPNGMTFPAEEIENILQAERHPPVAPSGIRDAVGAIAVLAGL